MRDSLLGESSNNGESGSDNNFVSYMAKTSPNGTNDYRQIFLLIDVLITDCSINQRSDDCGFIVLYYK